MRMASHILHRVRASQSRLITWTGWNPVSGTPFSWRVPLLTETNYVPNPLTGRFPLGGGLGHD